ncbi:MAG: carboxypeptidase-like regulatory domain-containing protein, partial [Cyclobacteriaceae bacterium]
MKNLIIILLLMPIVVNAQNITGVVKDISNGEALPGANVYIKDNNSSGTATNYEGIFSIHAKDGDTLLISFIGFNEALLIVGQQNDYIINLLPDKQQMQEVVVKAERLIAEEFTQKKINRIEIYTNPSAKADPILAVNSTAAATTTDESANISLRGSSPAETGIFLNNVPVNDAVRYSQLNGIGTFSIFNTALIKNVLVFPGNPPLEFGNTTSGLISLQTDE